MNRISRVSPAFSIFALCLFAAMTLPASAATNTDIKTQLAMLESNLIQQGRPIDPITKMLAFADANVVDQARAIFFTLVDDQMPMREMKRYYGLAAKQYDIADKLLLEELTAYNTGDYKTAETNLAQAKYAIQEMRQNITSGISFYPQVLKVSYTLFISSAARTPIEWVGGLVGFLTPISDRLIDYAANPDSTLEIQTKKLVAAEFLHVISSNIHDYLIEDPVHEAVGKSFIWKSLGDTQKEEINYRAAKLSRYFILRTTRFGAFA